MLEESVKKLIEKNKWPMRDSFINSQVKSFVFDLQKVIAELSKQDKKDLVFELMDMFSFNLSIRLYIIHEISKKPARLTSDFGGFQLRADSDCLLLLKETRWVLIAKHHGNIKTKILRKVSPKKNKPARMLGIYGLKDLVLQKMLVLLIEPYYESILHDEVFGFRQGRLQMHAVADLTFLVTQGQRGKTVILLNIQKCFDQILTSKLKQIRVPSKFRKITDNWLQDDIFKCGSKEFIVSSERGVSQGSTIGPLFTNIILNNLKSAAFSDFPKKLNRDKNLGKTNVSNHCLTYAGDVVIIFNVGKLSSILSNIANFLNSLGLEINKEKTKVIRLSKKKLHFDYLGFRFLYVPIKKLRLGSLVQQHSNLHAKKGSNEPGKMLMTVSPASLTSIKDKLKSIIRSSYNFSVPQLIDKLNPIIRRFGDYFNWGHSYRVLS